ncbi:MAG: outer membrane lipoprotein-sorting protein [Spirochaetaceae bacterium]|jgi:outer membrane lipoprotein-sorting protein|nr:outer membrane lipoprotein-sorting protein [Spirochaetaceae bacterium]
MKKVFYLCFMVSAAFAWAGPDDELLKQVDGLASYMDADFSAVYEIVQQRPGQDNTVTRAGLYRRDIKEQYVIIIIEPAVSRGQGYLKEGNTIWFYDPESMSFNSTSSRERFQNSNASNADFTRSTLSIDYRPVSASNEMLGKFKCRVLNLQAVSKNVVYPKTKIWVSEDGLVRKTEDYSLSGQLLRTTEIPSYYKIGTRYVPKAIRIIDALRGARVNGIFQNETTIISITNPSFDKVDNIVFSKAYLENINRRKS